jgi:hypothetical protein
MYILGDNHLLQMLMAHFLDSLSMHALDAHPVVDLLQTCWLPCRSAAYVSAADAHIVVAGQLQQVRQRGAACARSGNNSSRL